MHLKLSDEEHRPMTDFTANTQNTVQYLRVTKRPLVLTAEGQEVAVLLSPEAFHEMREAVEVTALQRAVDEAEQGIAEGRWVDHAEVEAKLKRWAAGEP